MLRGLYTATTGLSAIMLRNEVETNNLVNAKTVGYKKEEVIFKSFQSRLTERINYERPHTTNPQPIGILGRGVRIDDVVTYVDTPGQLSNTSRDLDLAIKGSGYFAVQNPQGEKLYTRNGIFDLNQNSQLINATGDLVLGQGGPIEIQGTQIVIKEDGQIYVDDQYVDTLLVVDLADPKKVGGNLFSSDQEAQAFTGQVLQNYLEQSNADPIEGMTKYLKNLRAYEANQKVVQAYDATLEKLINEVGRV